METKIKKWIFNEEAIAFDTFNFWSEIVEKLEKKNRLDKCIISNTQQKKAEWMVYYISKESSFNGQVTTIKCILCQNIFNFWELEITITTKQI